MKNNQENSADNQIIDTSKSVKIDFRLPTVMKNMIVATAKEKGIKVSQFITHLVEKFYEEQAKQDRLAMEADQQKQLVVREKYADYNKKKKHKKGDFTVDEPTSKNQNKSDDSTLLNFLITITVIIVAWQGFVFIKKIIARKKTEKSYQQWQSQQNFQNSKSNLNQSDKQSDKSSPTT
jgi:hypothetical protein